MDTSTDLTAFNSTRTFEDRLIDNLVVRYTTAAPFIVREFDDENAMCDICYSLSAFPRIIVGCRHAFCGACVRTLLNTWKQDYSDTARVYRLPECVCPYCTVLIENATGCSLREMFRLMRRSIEMLQGWDRAWYVSARSTKDFTSPRIALVP